MEVQIGCMAIAELPAKAQFRRWSEAALERAGKPGAGLAIRVMDEGEIEQLNRRFRRQAKPTNVLSFSCEILPDVEIPLIGDIAICAPVVAREAREQGKSPAAHWAHMVIHGVLHLCGFDHQQDAEAEEMEQLEREILLGLGYDDPYR